MPAYIYKNVRVNKRGKSTPIEIEAGGQWFRSSDESFVGASRLPEAAEKFEEITEPEFILRLLEQHAESPFVQQQEPSEDPEAAPAELTEAEVIDMAKQGFAALLAEVSELPHGLDVVKEVVKSKVDVWAGDVRKQFITEAPGQQLTYGEKRAEAEEWMAAGQPDDQADYPFLFTESAATGKTVLELATEIINNSRSWKSLGAQIEGARMKAKNAVTVATDIDAISDAVKVCKAELLAVASV